MKVLMINLIFILDIQIIVYSNNSDLNILNLLSIFYNLF